MGEVPWCTAVQTSQSGKGIALAFLCHHLVCDQQDNSLQKGTLAEIGCVDLALGMELCKNRNELRDVF